MLLIDHIALSNLLLDIPSRLYRFCRSHISLSYERRRVQNYKGITLHPPTNMNDLEQEHEGKLQMHMLQARLPCRQQSPPLEEAFQARPSSAGGGASGGVQLLSMNSAELYTPPTSETLGLGPTSNDSISQTTFAEHLARQYGNGGGRTPTTMVQKPAWIPNSRIRSRPTPSVRIADPNATDYSSFAASVASHLQLMSSPMKTDGFLNWTTDVEVPTSGSDVLDSNTNSNRSNIECPNCSKLVDAKTCSMHEHVSKCFLSNHSMSNRSLAEGNAMQNMQQVQSSIGLLDLRTRLAIMESLYRLSKSEGSKTSSALTPSVSSKAEKHDNCVLAMLYGENLKNDPKYSLEKVFAVPQVIIEPSFRLPEFDSFIDDKSRDRGRTIPGAEGTQSLGGNKRRRLIGVGAGDLRLGAHQ